LKHTALINTKT